MLDDAVSLGEGGVHIATVLEDAHADVVGKLRMDGWRAGGHGVLRVRQRVQGLVFDIDKLGGVSGGVGVFGNEHGDGLADVDDLLSRQDGMLRGADVVDDSDVNVSGAGDADVLFHVFGGEDGDDAGGAAGGGGVKGGDAGVGVGASQNDGVEGAFEADVIHEGGLASDEVGGLQTA